MRPLLTALALCLVLSACAAGAQPSGQDKAAAQPAEITHPHSDGRDSGDNSPSPSRGGGMSPSHGSGPGPHK